MTSDSEVEGDVVEDCSQICTNVIFSSCHDIQQNRHPLPKYLEANEISTTSSIGVYWF